MDVITHPATLPTPKPDSYHRVDTFMQPSDAVTQSFDA